MSDIVTPIGRSLPGVAGPNIVTGTITDPPRNLIGLAPGTILKGTVLGRGPDGLTAVATDKGTVNVATTAQLPPGSAVTLEVRNAGDRLQVLILSVDTAAGRQAPATTASGAGTVGGSTPTPPDSDAAAPSRPPPPTIEFIGSSVRAIVVQTPPDASLLPTPDVEVEPFTPPPIPITAPADAAQKAQILAQARLLVQPALTDLIAPPAESAPPTASGAAPATVPTPQQATTVAGSGTVAAAANIAVVATALQPEVAQRIAALFAAEGGTATQAPITGPTGLSPLLFGAVQPNVIAPITLPSGTELTLHVVAVLANKGGEIEIAPEAAKLAGGVVPVLGKVLGYTRAGHPVIETPAGVMMLQQRTRLPVGAQVALVLEPGAPPTAVPLMPVTSPQQALVMLSNAWPTLDDLIAVLRGGGSPDAPSPPPPPGVPQTGPKLAAGLAGAIAALRSGDAEALLSALLAGRKVPADKEDVVKRLRDEFAQLSSLAQDRPGVDWRALFLPIYDPRAGLTQINLYYRRGGGGSDDAEGKDRGTRFLVEVNFAVLGAFQLDGLIRGKRFDLMIRSRRALSPTHRRKINAVFEEALAIGGTGGGLEFRTVEHFPVSPLDELRGAHEKVTA